MCKSIVGIDASQIYAYSMCQPMPTGLYTRWDIDSETCRFTPRQNKTQSYENMVLSYFQRTRPDCKIENFYSTGRQRKIDHFSVDGFCSHCNTVFEAMGCFYHFCPCQGLSPSLTEEDVKRGSRRRELDELGRSYIQEKDFTVTEIWECEWWRLYKTTANIKLHMRENFLYRRSLTEQQLLEGKKNRSLFGSVQCDIEVPENLRVNFANFPPIFKNIFVSKNDIGGLMKKYAEEGGIMSQPRKKLISSFTLKMELWLLLCSCSICNWGLLLRKYTVLSNTLQRNASTVSCSQKCTQEGKVTKFPIQVSSQKQWSF